MKTVVIFGGSGFVGKHIIRRLAKNGHKIIIPHQNQINEAKIRILGNTGQVIPIKFRSLEDKNIINLVIKADIILNLKTIWDEKKINFKKGILNFNKELVDIIKNKKKTNHFIYFSGIGISSMSASNRSKAIHLSEQYIEKNLKNATIVKPGIILGGEDNFLKRLMPLIKISFFIPLFGTGNGKFQPVFIDDVSLAISKIIEFPMAGFNVFEFVGNQIFTYKEFYNYLAFCMKKTRVFIPLPFSICKFGISILEKTPFSPLSSEQLNLFESDNIASKKFKNLEILGIKPQDLKEIVKRIVIKNL